ncbi:MAG TPA: hypothetical protein VNS32_20735 [Flavisolibacter sp.]|jgi:hypothetical protein|nr:hypothetical protein [Flavisolibacter sp.]
MKKSVLEKIFIGVLFIIALLTFSFAERDSKKLDTLYKGTTAGNIQKEVPSVTGQLPLANINIVRN